MRKKAARKCCRGTGLVRIEEWIKKEWSKRKEDAARWSNSWEEEDQIKKSWRLQTMTGSKAGPLVFLANHSCKVWISKMYRHVLLTQIWLKSTLKYTDIGGSF